MLIVKLHYYKNFNKIVSKRIPGTFEMSNVFHVISRPKVQELKMKVITKLTCFQCSEPPRIFHSLPDLVLNHAIIKITYHYFHETLKMNFGNFENVFAKQK